MDQSINSKPIPRSLSEYRPISVTRVGVDYYVDYDRHAARMTHVCCYEEYGLVDDVRCVFCGKTQLRDDVPFYNR